MKKLLTGIIAFVLTIALLPATTHEHDADCGYGSDCIETRDQDKFPSD